MLITVLDSIDCQADKEAIQVIKEGLKYESSFWQKSAFGKKKITRDAYFVDGRTGIFLTGLLPRIIENGFPEENISYDGWEVFESTGVPKLKGIKFRDYQLDAIEAAIHEQRGVIKVPTGMGKTIIAMGLMSCYPNANILFLCHSVSILKQTLTELKEKGLKANLIQGQNKEIKEGINVASKSSFVKIDPDKYLTFFDIIFVDECHHVIKRNSQYGKLLQNLLAPIKIGLTATLPEGVENILTLEGLIGPVIYEKTINDGVESGFFVKPKIKLIPVPKQSYIEDMYKYQEIYQHAIVQSEIRNKLICEETAYQISKGKSVLIIVIELDHGDNLMDMFYEQYPKIADDILFVKGSTESAIREEVRVSLNQKNIKACIATTVFKEGINIKTLDCVILAPSGKSTIALLQNIGRGTRIAKNKNELVVVDFIDRYRYLSSHFAERLTIYIQEGWM